MGVMVYSRLGDLLRVRNLTVRDLQQKIAARFGLALDTRSLDRLARDERVRRPNMELVVAAATVLEVGLDDVFDSKTVSEIDGSVADREAPGGVPDNGEEQQDVLTPAQRQRLDALFALQDQRLLTEDERIERDALVKTYGHALNEQGLHELARRSGVPVARVRAEVMAETDRVLAWLQDVQADPVRLAEVVAEAKEQQRIRGIG